MKRFLYVGMLAIALSGGAASQASAVTIFGPVGPGNTGFNVSPGDVIDFQNTVSPPGANDEYVFTTATSVTLGISADAAASAATGFTSLSLTLDNGPSTLGSSSATGSGGFISTGFNDVVLAADTTYELFVGTIGSGFYNGSLTFAAAPIPASFPLLLAGLVGLWGWRRMNQASAI